MRPAALASALAVAALAVACSPKAPAGIDAGKLDDGIAATIGDPQTCVLVVKKGSGEIVYRYGSNVRCTLALPTCEGQGTATADDMAKAAARGLSKQASCGQVGWSAGPVPTSKPEQYGDLAYVAAMNSPRALPGREMTRRLERAFADAGF